MVLPLLKCHISIYEHPFWSPNELAKCQRGSTMTLNRSGDDAENIISEPEHFTKFVATTYSVVGSWHRSVTRR